MSTIILQILGIIAAVIIAILTSPLTSKIFDLLTDNNNIFSKRRKRKDVKEILKHNFFSFMEYAINVRIKNLNFGSPVKTAIYKDLLYIKFTTFKINLKDYIDDYIDYNKDKDSNVLKEDMLSVLHSSIKEYESKWNDLDIENIEYIKQLFSQWHYKAVVMVNDFIERVFDSNIYENNAERMSVILDIYTVAFEATLLDVEEGLRPLNGHFEHIQHISKYYSEKK
jgi:hypothetical protein